MVSGGHSDRSLTVNGRVGLDAVLVAINGSGIVVGVEDLEPDLEVPDIIDAKDPMAPIPAEEDEAFAVEPVLGPSELFPDESLFLTLIRPQSCHELQILQTLPFSSSIKPGGKLG